MTQSSSFSASREADEHGWWIDDEQAICSCGWRSRSYSQEALCNVAGVNHVTTVEHLKRREESSHQVIARTSEMANVYLRALRDIAEWQIPEEPRQARARSMRRIAQEALLNA